jgi:secreted trypsin-like serine protease
MTANKLIRNPLWATLLAALVAAMVSYIVFVPNSEAAQAADGQIYEPQIIDGKAVPNGKYPFMAALLDKRIPGGAFDEQYCGGALIDKDTLLTAAHCFFDAKGDPDPQSVKVLRVIVGRTVLNSNQGQVRSVKRLFIHPKYKPKSASFDYDAAVLELSRPVSGIVPIKLASSEEDNLEKPGRKATVAGWGSTIAQPPCKPSNRKPVYADRMREAQLPIVSDSKADRLYEDICQFAKPALYTPSLMVAAGGTGKDTCQGDSGGPLFVRTSGDGDNGDDKNGGSSAKYTQIGITSFGPGCGPERYPGAYTEVDAKPIASFIRRAADNGNGDGDDSE